MESYLDLVVRISPLLFKGLVITLQVFFSAASLSLILGLCFGIFASRQLKIPFLTPLIEAITFVYRAVPFFVQLLIVYFVLPDLIGFNFEPFSASILALGMCSSGYVSQIIRNGMNGIPLMQWEACKTLGYSTWQTLYHVILPQVLRSTLAPLNNELDSLLKSTAIVSSIGMLELTRMGMNIVSREMNPVPIYLTIALFYLCLSALLNFLARKLERKMVYVKS